MPDRFFLPLPLLFFKNVSFLKKKIFSFSVLHKIDIDIDRSGKVIRGGIQRSGFLFFFSFYHPALANSRIPHIRFAFCICMHGPGIPFGLKSLGKGGRGGVCGRVINNSYHYVGGDSGPFETEDPRSVEGEMISTKPGSKGGEGGGAGVFWIRKEASGGWGERNSLGKKLFSDRMHGTLTRNSSSPPFHVRVCAKPTLQ